MKITASAKLVALATQFLAAPAAALEPAILETLNADLREADYEALDDAFIEWACIEHGIIDVFAFAGQQVIRIDPVSTEITAL
jgi:transcription-repair coupling factor (superfamily II helicase)